MRNLPQLRAQSKFYTGTPELRKLLSYKAKAQNSAFSHGIPTLLAIKILFTSLLDKPMNKLSAMEMI